MDYLTVLEATDVWNQGSNLESHALRGSWEGSFIAFWASGGSRHCLAFGCIPSILCLNLHISSSFCVSLYLPTAFFPGGCQFPLSICIPFILDLPVHSTDLFFVNCSRVVPGVKASVFSYTHIHMYMLFYIIFLFITGLYKILNITVSYCSK